MKNNTKAEVLAAATRVASRVGYMRVTRDAIAAEACVAPSTVQYHFRDTNRLRNAILINSIKTENLRVILQGLGMLHPVALHAPASLKTAALKLLNEEIVKSYNERFF